MQKLLLVFTFCAAGLLFEKVLIQWIACKFHEKSYADRIASQKFAVKVLVTLYSKSRDIPGRTDTLRTHNAVRNRDPTTRLIKQAIKGVRVAATSTTMALGNVASEIAGSSVLQPNSPSAIIQVSLESPKKSRLLARRLFYSFVKPEATSLLIGDIAGFFPNREDAEAAFALFDRDSNHDVTRDEVELACIDIRHEQLSIEHSMHDMDNAVGRLDNLLISVYAIGAAGLTVAVALQAQLVALLTGAGTLLLGATWLIGASLQEVLASIIFLCIKHPFDVGDRVNILKEYYTVKEIHLLSTIFLDSQGCFVQVPNVVLNTTYIQNLCRSSQMSESFSFDVDYGTTFEQLEELRDKMLTFLKTQKRDFFPTFDVAVVDFPNQEKLSLAADIKYKSNWQPTTLKTRRRNKWICALKAALADVKVFGTKGNPKSVRHPDQHTIVPWEEVKAEQEAKEKDAQQEKVDASDTPKMPAGGWKLLEDNDLIQSDTGDVFGGPMRLV
jgi:small-conductance mechanosensitive channel